MTALAFSSNEKRDQSAIRNRHSAIERFVLALRRGRVLDGAILIQPGAKDATSAKSWDSRIGRVSLLSRVPS